MTVPLNYNYFRKCLEESVFDEFKIKLNLMGAGVGWSERVESFISGGVFEEKWNTVKKINVLNWNKGMSGNGFSSEFLYPQPFISSHPQNHRLHRYPVIESASQSAIHSQFDSWQGAAGAAAAAK